MQKLNTFHLKLIAVFLMLCDHIAYVFIPMTSPLYIPMRCIGRLAAPIFWFCFVEGYKHTKDKKKYAIRLICSAAIMMMGNIILNILFLALNISSTITAIQPNMFFTLAMIFIALIILEKIKEENWTIKIAYGMTAILFLLVTGLFAEYSWYAVFSILCLYFVKNQVDKYRLFIIGNIILSLMNDNPYQIFMVLSVIFFFYYKDEKPKRSWKWFFYLFYPVHLWVFFIIKCIIEII